LLRELFYINGSELEANGSGEENLLLLLSEHLLSTVIYHPSKKEVFSWRVSELPSELINQEDAVREYLTNQSFLLNWKGKIDVVTLTGRQSIVPLSIYNEYEPGSFAHLQFPSGNEDQLIADKDEETGLAVLYSMNHSVLRVINTFFPDSVITHVFHHYLKTTASENPLLHVNIVPSHCIITVQYKQKWQLLQSYQYNTGEDVLYLILKSMNQLGIDPDQAQVCVNGLVDRKSTLAQLLEQYIPNLDWGGELGYTYPEVDGFDKHSFSFIDRILSCVS
jgi:hypothetical protein